MLTCIRSKRQRDAAEYALRTIQSSCIRPYIKTIYLYGSCARGEEKYSSDVDLFLELSESFRSRPELKKYLYQIHVFLLTRYVGRMGCGRFRTSAERPL